LVADLAEMRLHAVGDAAVFGVGAELLDIRMAFLGGPCSLRQPIRAADREFADVRLYARMNASLAGRYARAQGLEIDCT
jgi:hypothetical protein